MHFHKKKTLLKLTICEKNNCYISQKDDKFAKIHIYIPIFKTTNQLIFPLYI